MYDRLHPPPSNGRPPRLEDEPLSPELALVDPVLARYARELLPDRPGPPFRPAAVTREWPSVLPVPRLQVEESAPVLSVVSSPTRATVVESAGAAPPVFKPRVLNRRRTVGLAAAVVLATVALGRASADDALPRPAADAVRAAVQEGRLPTPPSRATPTKRTTAKPRPTTKLSLAAAASPSFVWLADARASGYRVSFFRGSRLVYMAVTKRPRLELPRAWSFRGKRLRLTAGSYRWYVWPLYGKGKSRSQGETIVQATYRL